MTIYDNDSWEYAQEEAFSRLIERSINEQRAEQITSYLGIFGDAVQARVNRCLSEGQNLLDLGFASQAVVSAVTAVELILRYFIVRPILEGAFLSDEWTYILMDRILSRRAAGDREILRSILRAWKIDLDSICLPSGKPLWNKFINELIPLRNNIVHKGAQATGEQARAVLYAEGVT
jgi:hypothetical protein